MEKEEIKFYKDYKIDLYRTFMANIEKFLQIAVSAYLFNKMLNLISTFDSPELVLFGVFGFIFVMLKYLNYTSYRLTLQYRKR